MPNIDIPVPDDLQKLFQLPGCLDISLPPPGTLKVQLPTGGALQAFVDMGKGIPNDCSLTFSLLLQIAPLLASLECLLKILKLLKPMIDVIQGLTKVPPAPPVKAVEDMVKAIADIAPCLLVPTPAIMIPFVKDLLCLIMRVLNCLLSQLKSIAGILGGLAIQINTAQANGNTELVGVLECAQSNAQTSAQHMMTAIEPISVLLDLAGGVMGIAGVPAIKLPALGSSTDVAALNAAVDALQGVVDLLKTITDGLGGCD